MDPKCSGKKPIEGKTKRTKQNPQSKSTNQPTKLKTEQTPLIFTIN